MSQSANSNIVLSPLHFQATRGSDPRVHQVIELMSAKLHLNLSAKEIAHAVNLSPSRLRNLFKTETGMSLTQFHKQLKMEKAKELLAEEFITVKQVMDVLKINDVSHFTRDFKKAYGIPPGQYRLHPGKISLNLDEQ